MEPVIVVKEFTFDSAHRLDNPYLDPKVSAELFGKCFELHGHTYHLFVAVKGSVNERSGMVINFVDLKKIVTNEIINVLDHKYLNEVGELKGIVVTCENMLIWMWEKLVNAIPNLYELKLYETPTSYAIYRGPTSLKELNLADTVNLKENVR